MIGGCHLDDIFRVQAYFMQVCMNVRTWFCMFCGNVAVCMGVFNLLTEDIVLSQEAAAADSSAAAVSWHWKHSQTLI